MYGGYGGLSSMYGGLGGGMSPMYGGLGGGMSSMYGGLGGGMSSMYGGLGGGMSSMYGGGMGGNGLTGNMMGGGMSTGMGGGMLGSNGENTNSLLPPQCDQQTLRLPTNAPINETPKERRARRRQERMQEKEAIEKHRQQKRQFAIHSTIEVAGHVLQILIQVMRSGLELFGVGFGTYYSIKALKALVKSQENSVPRSVVQKAVIQGNGEVLKDGGIPKSNKWKVWLLISMLFLTLEGLYNVLQRLRNPHGRRAINRGQSDILLTDEDEELQENLDETSECSSDDESSMNSTLSVEDIYDSTNVKGKSKKRVFIAVYDYESPERDGFLGFKAGDRFVIEDYAENGWCEATLVDGSERMTHKGLVPGNFLRVLEGETKL
ncbi:SH3 domain protein [Trypanosoma theileri]|uniref:SH3 domain protein n=1 Tax=Trypanosoma theileri TaxID=67003 RepID=A0A1X0P6F7_9TRYP|nr:SH3 domain protein [Trypanosoma theileri]ORC92524.1 SH3 domain protein [Trypanosoma theileri]